MIITKILLGVATEELVYSVPKRLLPIGFLGGKLLQLLDHLCRWKCSDWIISPDVDAAYDSYKPVLSQHPTDVQQ